MEIMLHKIIKPPNQLVIRPYCYWIHKTVAIGVCVVIRPKLIIYYTHIQNIHTSKRYLSDISYQWGYQIHIVGSSRIEQKSIARN
jgi:hypothetical protein